MARNSTKNGFDGRDVLGMQLPEHAIERNRADAYATISEEVAAGAFSQTALGMLVHSRMMKLSVLRIARAAITRAAASAVGSPAERSSSLRRLAAAGGCAANSVA